ncbi:MAG TPA: sigma 54-interacting transcriptional regulator [Myxococcota bacterium]|nr:sigma 54-interacting transcriptional regulator [Myxococcota bacterium]HRY95901.1 sigma 54-interacting transcriptional regulator [Myxococcota bacterium]HSA23080.1 sigma 54-interacting transcriptional regulator [Myxococcota bacterium]
MSQDDSRTTSLLAGPSEDVRRDLGALRLLVVEGPDAGRACAVGPEPIQIGTDPACELVLVDGTVSRRHLLAKLAPGGVWLQDPGSTNGTFYEGSRVRELVLAPGALVRLGQTALKIVPEERGLRPAPLEASSFHGVLGQSRRMREIFATAAEVAGSEVTVLLEGETGTGKEALAEAIHRASPRRDAPFVVLDCTAIPRDLAESELFGHRKGAFTGAQADRAGCFEQARGGTLLLDEVGELAAELQPKLLRALERKQIRPVGADRPVEVDVRLIAATHRELRREVAEGRFREDLFYRLAVVSLRLPPLRERSEDLPQLLAHFLVRAAGEREGWRAEALPAGALTALQAYPWPGNIRELRNAVDRAAALLGAASGRPFEPRAFVAELERAIGEGTARQGGAAFKDAKGRVVDAFERAYLLDLLARHRGNLSAAAREARLDRHHLKDLLKKHGLEGR